MIVGMFLRATTVFFILIAAILPLQSADKEPMIEVVCPTIVAFFPPVTDAELSKNPDTGEALSDFHLYADTIREPLKQRGIDFHEVYAHSFTIRTTKAKTRFKPGKVDVGYYLLVPGRKPRIEYGVLTDTDLLQIADEYFRIPKK